MFPLPYSSLLLPFLCLLLPLPSPPFSFFFCSLSLLPPILTPSFPLVHPFPFIPLPLSCLTHSLHFLPSSYPFTLLPLYTLTPSLSLLSLNLHPLHLLSIPSSPTYIPFLYSPLPSYPFPLPSLPSFPSVPSFPSLFLYTSFPFTLPFRGQGHAVGETPTPPLFDGGGGGGGDGEPLRHPGTEGPCGGVPQRPAGPRCPEAPAGARGSSRTS